VAPHRQADRIERFMAAREILAGGQCVRDVG